MRPARQGAFDGLCGVYAVINALELVGVTGRRSSIHNELWLQLTHALGAAALLSAMHEGLEPYELMRAADVGLRWLKTVHGIQLEMVQPFEEARFGGLRRFVQALRELAAEPETAVIISFKKPGLSHWSVVKEVHGGVITLRDSGGLGELTLDDFSITRGPYRFRPEETLVIRRVS